MSSFRNDFLFECELESVHERLQQALWTNAIGANSVLHAGNNPTLPPDGEESQQNQHGENRNCLENHQPPWVSSKEPELGTGHWAPPCTTGVSALAATVTESP